LEYLSRLRYFIKSLDNLVLPDIPAPIKYEKPIYVTREAVQRHLGRLPEEVIKKICPWFLEGGKEGPLIIVAKYDHFKDYYAIFRLPPEIVQTILIDLPTGEERSLNDDYTLVGVAAHEVRHRFQWYNLGVNFDLKEIKKVEIDADTIEVEALKIWEATRDLHKVAEIIRRPFIKI
jgi:hypothetical protein